MASAGSTSGAASSSGDPDPGPPAQKKVRKFWMPDGKYRELKPGEVRPYKAPQLGPDPESQPSEIKTLEARSLAGGREPEVLARPDPGSPMIGTVAPGTRLRVRGELTTDRTDACPKRRWLALVPFGWMCAEYRKPTDAPPTDDPIYKIVPGERVPYRYVMVYAKEPLPMWASLDALKAGDEPERNLAKGDTVAIEKTVKHLRQTYYQSAEGKILPVQGTYTPDPTSAWHGILIDKTPLPFSSGSIPRSRRAGLRSERLTFASRRRCTSGTRTASRRSNKSARSARPIVTTRRSVWRLPRSVAPTACRFSRRSLPPPRHHRPPPIDAPLTAVARVG
jgi:hypothetical protein